MEKANKSGSTDVESDGSDIMRDINAVINNGLEIEEVTIQPNLQTQQQASNLENATSDGAVSGQPNRFNNPNNERRPWENRKYQNQRYNGNKMNYGNQNPAQQDSEMSFNANCFRGRNIDHNNRGRGGCSGRPNLNYRWRQNYYQSDSNQEEGDSSKMVGNSSANVEVAQANEERGRKSQRGQYRGHNFNITRRQNYHQLASNQEEGASSKIVKNATGKVEESQASGESQWNLQRSRHPKHRSTFNMRGLESEISKIQGTSFGRRFQNRCNNEVHNDGRNNYNGYRNRRGNKEVLRIDQSCQTDEVSPTSEVHGIEQNQVFSQNEGAVGQNNFVSLDSDYINRICLEVQNCRSRVLALQNLVTQSIVLTELETAVRSNQPTLNIETSLPHDGAHQEINPVPENVPQPECNFEDLNESLESLPSQIEYPEELDIPQQFRTTEFLPRFQELLQPGCVQTQFQSYPQQHVAPYEQQHFVSYAGYVPSLNYLPPNFTPQENFAPSQNFVRTESQQTNRHRPVHNENSETEDAEAAAKDAPTENQD